jgi:hypothetical protein
MKKIPILHPVLLALYPALFLYSTNVGEFDPSQPLIPMVVCVGFALVMWAVGWRILGDGHKSGLLVSLILFFFFAYGRLKTATMTDEWVPWMSTGWVLLFAAATVLLLRTRQSLAPLSQAINIAAIVLIGLCLVNLGRFVLHGQSAQEEKEPTSLKRVTGGVHSAPPDIYLILLDAYARADVLEEIYSFDNREFLDSLRSRDFYIADNSSSNYMQTLLSLTACLDADYLDAFAQKVGVRSRNHRPLRRKLQKTRVLQFLREQGYTIVAFATDQPETELPSADVRIDFGRTVDYFTNALLNTTPLPDIYFAGGGPDVFADFRNRILYIIEQTAEASKLARSPMFVFSYIESPHPPFVFGPKGERLRPGNRLHHKDGDRLIGENGITREEYIEGYRDQVTFMNSKVLDMVDEILKRSARPPIIILFGDHGPRAELFWQSAEKTNQREAMTNLAAFHLPDDGAKALYPSISPVNYFRIILPHYFGVDLERVADRNYFSTVTQPFRFHDVTTRVAEPTESVE